LREIENLVDAESINRIIHLTARTMAKFVCHSDRCPANFPKSNFPQFFPQEKGGLPKIGRYRPNVLQSVAVYPIYRQPIAKL
jgi:hypothetical protein